MRELTPKSINYCKSYRKLIYSLYPAGSKSRKWINKVIKDKQHMYFTVYQTMKGVGRWRNPKRIPQNTFMWSQLKEGK